MRLTRTTAWVGGAALLGLVLVAATWLLLVGPRQQLAADLREQTASTAAQNELLTAQVRRLEEQLGDVPTTRAEVAALREQVPADAQLPALLRQVTELSDLAGAQLTGVTPTEPSDVPAAAAVPAEAPADASADATAPTTPAPTEPTAPGGVQVVPVALTATGSFAQLQELLRLVQVELPRALLVRSVSLTAGEGEDALQLSVAADALVLPTTPQEEQLVALAAAATTAPDETVGAAPRSEPAPAPASTPGDTDPSAASAAAPPTREDPL
ncbi:hypothetical protein WDV85_13265 [Pseudokineococcus sp. 5B2Z-1]|uniref:hypothetical protein n=1 Tax=Pseudokineococcus sp. 5B2Z-1 TaxID=3132744 RepID=UPI003095FB4D